MKTNRREFMKMAGLAGTALATSGWKAPSMRTSQKKDLRFVYPVDGDMLNEYDGREDGGDLLIPARVSAPSGSRIRLNGVEAKEANGLFVAEIGLSGYDNVMELVDIRSGAKETIRIFRLKHYTNRYRFSIDDNIWFLQDLTKNAARYGSLFDNPYLAVIKKIHDAYGAKFHLNIYYQTEGFNLSQMTDKFKSEWKANANWLELSFHALANDPDEPYKNATYAQVQRDCTLVKDQIRRFAGEELMGPETTLHWGEGTVEACRALRDAGYTILAGYFNVDDDQYPVSYYLTPDQRRNLKKRFIWRDNKEGLIFSRIALVVNTVKREEVVPYLENLKKTSHPRYLDLMIHEQYYYPHYKDYQPDWAEKVTASIKWAADNGYKPAFLKDSVLSS